MSCMIFDPLLRLFPLTSILHCDVYLCLGAPIIPRTAIDGHLIKPAEIKAKQAELEAIAKAVSPDTTTVMNVVNDSIEAEMKTKLSESGTRLLYFFPYYTLC